MYERVCQNQSKTLLPRAVAARYLLLLGVLRARVRRFMLNDRDELLDLVALDHVRRLEDQVVATLRKVAPDE